MSAAAPSAEARGASAEPMTWELGEVYRCAWHAFRASWVVLVAAALLAAVIPEAPDLLLELDPDATDATRVVRYYGACAVGSLLLLWLEAGLIRMWVSAARGKVPRLNQLFSVSALPAVIAVDVLYGLSMVAGAVGLVVGAFVALTAFVFAPFFVVAGKMNPVQAMKASWNLTKGKRLMIFLAMLPGSAFGAGGFVVSFPGSGIVFRLVLVPVMGIAAAIIFLRMTGGALRAALPPPDGFGPAAYSDRSLRMPAS